MFYKRTGLWPDTQVECLEGGAGLGPNEDEKVGNVKQEVRMTGIQTAAGMIGRSGLSAVNGWMQMGQPVNGRVGMTGVGRKF